MVARGDVESGPSVYLDEMKLEDGVTWYKFLGANGEMFWGGIDSQDQFWIDEEIE